MSILFNSLAGLIIASTISSGAIKEDYTGYANIYHTDIDATDETVIVEEPEDNDDIPNIRTFEWQDGDSLYKIAYNGQVLSYILMHSSGEYEILSYEELQYVINSRAAKTGTGTRACQPQTIGPETFANLNTQALYDNCEDPNEAKYLYYTEITAIAMEQSYYWITEADMSTFVYDGETYHYFEYNGKYFRLNSYEYDQFLNGIITIYDGTSVSERGFGYGTLYLSVELGESVQIKDNDFSTAESIIVKAQSEAGDEYIFIVNPPTYIYFADLDVGEYRIVSVTSYEYPDYPMLCDITYFTIEEGMDCNLNLYVYRQQDEIEGSEYTPEEIIEIMEADEEMYIQYQEAQSQNAAVSANEVVEESNGMSRIISIALAVSAFIVILGVVMFFYKKNNEID